MHTCHERAKDIRAPPPFDRCLEEEELANHRLIHLFLELRFPVRVEVMNVAPKVTVLRCQLASCGRRTRLSEHSTGQRAAKQTSIQKRATTRIRIPTCTMTRAGVL